MDVRNPHEIMFKLSQPKLSSTERGLSRRHVVGEPGGGPLVHPAESQQGGGAAPPAEKTARHAGRESHPGEQSQTVTASHFCRCT